MRVPALRGPVEPAPEARGTCRPESLEWRARDVSAPCRARHLTPSPPTACALARLQSSEQAPPSAAASASLGGRTEPGCGDPAAEAPERTPPPPPPRGDGGKAAPARTEAVIAHPLSAPLVPAGARTKHACAGRAGGRARALQLQLQLQLQQAVRGARRPFAGAAAAAAAPPWGTEGAARD